MTALWTWVEQRTARPRLAFYIPAVALLAAAVALIEALT